MRPLQKRKGLRVQICRPHRLVGLDRQPRRQCIRGLGRIHPAERPGGVRAQQRLRIREPDASTGTASGDPQLPSPTHTLRANPARPARRIADPLENESQAASSSAVSSSSMSDGDSVPGCEDEEPGSGCTPNGGSPGPRKAYAGSALGFEKVRVNGHTSWEMYRLPRFVVPLTTGSRTLRAPRS